MKIFIERTNQHREIDFSGTVKDLLEKLQLNPETVIIARNNEIAVETDSLTNADAVKILSVISGG